MAANQCRYSANRGEYFFGKYRSHHRKNGNDRIYLAIHPYGIGNHLIQLNQYFIAIVVGVLCTQTWIDSLVFHFAIHLHLDLECERLVGSDMGIETLYLRVDELIQDAEYPTWDTYGVVNE